MDEENVELKSGDSLSEESITFRMVHKNLRDENFEPYISAFKPTKKDDNKLSVDYQELTTPEDSIGRFGATKKINGNFKNIDDFSIYSLETSFLINLPNNFISKVEYNPIHNDPLIDGVPNNKSHSLAHFIESHTDEPELLAKLWEHGKTRFIKFDRNKALQIAENLKSLYS